MNQHDFGVYENNRKQGGKRFFLQIIVESRVLQFIHRNKVGLKNCKSGEKKILLNV